MKYKDSLGNWVSIALPSLDSMPVGTIVEYSGQASDIPVGWQQVSGQNKIEKISMTTPTSAQIVDGYGTSTTDGYSQNYVNDINTYSENEINTGKTWIDGKPIYRKVYYNSNYSQSASRTQDISFALPNLDNVVSIYGSAKVSGVSYTLPNSMWTNTSGMQYSWNINAYTSTGFKINTGSDNPLSNAKIYLVIEYTKTTD